MEKILIYPFDREFIPILQYGDMLNDVEISKLISPRGWGLSNATVKIDNKDYFIESDFEAGIEKCDIVWFVDSFNDVYPKELLYEKVETAYKLNKEIFFIRSDYNEIMYVKKKFNCNSIRFLRDEINNYENIEWKDGKKYDIHTPVIAILGITEESGKFDIQLGLRKCLLEKGYRVSQIGTRKISELFGMHSFPDFMIDGKLKDRDKIIRFNHFVKKIELFENPDVIILGYPGGVFPVNEEIYNDFGSLSYKLSMALPIDCGIVASTYSNYNDEYFDDITKSIENKFDFPADFFGVSKRMIDWSDIDPNIDLSFVTVDSEVVENMVEQQKRENIFYTGNCGHYRKLGNRIVEKLEGYAKVETI